jgi:hypothetical protein
MLWTSHMSSFALLQDHLSFTEPSITYRNQLQEALNDDSITFTSLFVDFLKGTGIPCVQLFEDARVHFNTMVDLDQIGTDGFRSKMFCWATTGSCDRELDAPRISVCSVFVNYYIIIDYHCRYVLSKTLTPATLPHVLHLA